MLQSKMPFPPATRVVYNENPLVEVICQLRFPTLLEIPAADPAAFQTAIRAEYPEYERQDGGPGLPAGQFPPEVAAIVDKFGIPAGGPTYKFMTEDRLRAITLTKEWMAITDRNYERWERFNQAVQLATGALEQVYKPSFYSRVGLRYRNVIDRQQLGLEGLGWEELLSSELLSAMLASAELRPAVRRVETLALIRIDEVPGGFLTLRHGLVNGSQDGEVEKYSVDADFYTEDREATNDVPATVTRFNGLAGRLFRWAITETLHNALQPTEPD